MTLPRKLRRAGLLERDTFSSFDAACSRLVAWRDDARADGRGLSTLSAMIEEQGDEYVATLCTRRYFARIGGDRRFFRDFADHIHGLPVFHTDGDTIRCVALDELVAVGAELEK